jgi:aspartate/methionine/tyrosine aminotransferase
LITQNSSAILLGSALTIGPQISILAAHLAATVLLSPSNLPSFLTSSTSRLRSAYEYTTRFLQKHDIDFVPAVAGPFLFAKLGRKGEESEEKRIVEALKREKVKLIPGRQYHFNEWGWFRVVFALKRAELVEGLRRIVRATDGKKDMRKGNGITGFEGGHFITRRSKRKRIG